jgi:vancomycin permeability regulator SanA
MMAKSNYLGALAAAAGTLAAVGLLVLMLVVVDARSAGAAPPGKKFTKSSTKPQSGVSLVGGNAAGARITAANDPYSFSNTGRIASLKQVTIKATILEGDTGSGQFDENDLLLELDNINTGIALNGFRTGQTDTRTISGIPNQGRALKAALKADGKLAARIIDADPADEGGNGVGIPANFETTLRIKGTLTR